MRWHWKRHPRKVVRHRRGFLWRPKAIQGQVRWLEYAYWVEDWSSDDGHRGWHPLFWDDRLPKPTPGEWAKLADVEFIPPIGE